MSPNNVYQATDELGITIAVIVASNLDEAKAKLLATGSVSQEDLDDDTIEVEESDINIIA